MSAKNSKRESSRLDLSFSLECTPSNTLQLSGNFCFWNGDQYSGMVDVCKERQKLIRQGKGVYETGDGEIYEGTWHVDSLNGHCKITFLNGTVYIGNIKDMVIQGQGYYAFKGNVKIAGDFAENKLIGGAYLKDPNGNMWKGNISDCGSFVSFRPMHPFWQAVTNIRTEGSPSYYDANEEETENAWDSF